MCFLKDVASLFNSLNDGKKFLNVSGSITHLKSQFFTKMLRGWLYCIRTTLIPMVEASISTSKGKEKSGKDKIRASVISFFN